MPFLRILRDKRGIEHLSLWHSGRDGTEGHSRVLYWFRTSPGAKAGGRLPLDEATRLAIEGQCPDITFDWQTLWQTVTTATLPEPTGPAVKAGPTDQRIPVADLDGRRADRAVAGEPSRTGRPDQAARGVEQRGADRDRGRPRRKARSRRRPRVERHVASMDGPPSSEASE